MGRKTIDAGLRADIMRKQIETKNTLTANGSLYIGNGKATDLQGRYVTITNRVVTYADGTTETVDNAIDNNHIIFETTELSLGKADTVLQTDGHDLSYTKIKNSHIEIPSGKTKGEFPSIIAGGSLTSVDSANYSYVNIANGFNDNTGNLYINLKDDNDGQTKQEIKDYFLCNGQDNLDLSNLHCNDIDCKDVDCEEIIMNGQKMSDLLTSVTTKFEKSISWNNGPVNPYDIYIGVDLANNINPNSVTYTFIPNVQGMAATCTVDKTTGILHVSIVQSQRTYNGKVICTVPIVPGAKYAQSAIYTEDSSKGTIEQRLNYFESGDHRIFSEEDSILAPEES